MGKKQSELSVQGRHQAKNVRHILDSKINFSDIPELSNSTLKKGRKVGRPSIENPKQMIAFRIEPKLLGRLKKLAKKYKKPYQTLLHELIEVAVKEAA